MASLEREYQRVPSDCALAAIVSPNPIPASEVLKVLERMEQRGGPLGAGFAVSRWSEKEFIKAASRQQLTPDLTKNYYPITVWSYSSDVTSEVVEERLKDRGVVTLFREEIPTDPYALNAIGLSSRPLTLTRFFATVEDPKTSDPDPEVKRQKEFNHLAESVARLQKEDFAPREILIPSFTRVAGENERGFGGGIEIFKGVGTPKEIFNFYRELQEVQAELLFGHSRFPTLTSFWWGGAHPFQQGEWIGIHNGNIISYDVHVNALKKGYYALSAGTDSEAVPAMVDYLTRIKGLPIEVAFLVLRSPQWQQRAKLSVVERQFVNALNITYEEMMPDGPAGLILTNGREVYAMTGRHGVRPLHVTRTLDGRIQLASELGSISGDGAKRVSQGKIGTDGHVVVYKDDGQVATQEVKTKKVIEKAVRQKQFSQVGDLYEEIDLRDETHDGAMEEGKRLKEREIQEVHKALAQFGCSRVAIEKLEEKGRKGSIIMESQGEKKPLPIFRGENVRFLTFFQLGASEVGDPSLDPDRMPIDTVTFLGRKAESMMDVLKSPHKQVILSSPFLFSTRHIPESWSEFQETISDAAKTFGTAILDNPKLSRSLPEEMFSFVTTNFSENFFASILTICEKVEEEIKKGKSVIVLSDIVEGEDDPRDIIPATLVVRLVDQYLREKEIRHLASLVVESLEVTSSAEVMKTMALGADAVSIDPRIILSAMGLGKYDLGLDPLSANNILKEEAHIRAHNLFTAWTHQLKKLMGGADITGINNLRGNTALLQSLGLGKEMSFRLGVADDGVGRRTWDFFVRRGVVPFDVPEFTILPEYPLHHSPEFAAAVRRYLHRGELPPQPEKTDYFDLLKFKDLEGSDIDKETVSLQTKLFPYKDSENDLEREIGLPLVFGAISFGASVITLHRILGEVAAEQQTFYNTGEGGRPLAKFVDIGEFMEKGRRFLSDDSWTTFQVASGRFGVTMEVLRHSGVIEIKIAQGAKPGIGGHLPGKKVTEMIAHARGIPEGSSAISPSTQQDITSIEDLRALVSLLREATGSRTPIQVKLAALPGMVWIAVGAARCGVDSIVIDGFRGSTGAAPYAQQNEVGLPIATAIAAVDDALRKEGIRDKVSLIGGGGLRTVKEYLMLIALGADAVMVVTPLMEAMGCIQCGGCHEGTCPVGQTAQMGTPFEQRLKYEVAKPRLTKYLEQVKKDMKKELAALGLTSINQLQGRRDLLGLLENEETIKALDPTITYQKGFDYSGLADLASPLLLREWVDEETKSRAEILSRKIPTLLVKKPKDLDVFDAVDAINKLVNAGRTPGIIEEQRQAVLSIINQTVRQVNPDGRSTTPFLNHITGLRDAFVAKDKEILQANLRGLYALNELTQKLDLNRICGCRGECIHRKPVKGIAEKLVKALQPLEQELLRADTSDQERIVLDLRETPMRGDRYVGVALARMIDEIRERNPDMIRPIEVLLSGQAGHDLGAFLPRGMTVRVKEDGLQITGAGDGIGKSIQGGEIIIEGNGGDVVGYAAGQGGIFIKGSLDDLAGCNMRCFSDVEYPRLVVGGGVKNRAFEGMSGGVGVIIGHQLTNSQSIIGDNFASGIFGGAIYVHADEEEIRSHINSEHLVNLNITLIEADKEDILNEELKRWCLEFGVKLQEVQKGPWVKITSRTINPLQRAYGGH